MRRGELQSFRQEVETRNIVVESVSVLASKLSLHSDLSYACQRCLMVLLFQSCAFVGLGIFFSSRAAASQRALIESSSSSVSPPSPTSMSSSWATRLDRPRWSSMNLTLSSRSLVTSEGAKSVNGIEPDSMTAHPLARGTKMHGSPARLHRRHVLPSSILHFIFCLRQLTMTRNECCVPWNCTSQEFDLLQAWRALGSEDSSIVTCGSLLNA